MDVVLLLPGVGGMGGVAPVDMKVVFLTTSLCKKLVLLTFQLDALVLLGGG